jgi:hypothetical protein
MLQVIFGILGGIIAGFVLGCTKLFNNKYKRLIGIYGAGEHHNRRGCAALLFCVRLCWGMLFVGACAWGWLASIVLAHTLTAQRLNSLRRQPSHASRTLCCDAADART